MKEKLDVAFVRGSGADLTLSVLGSFQFRFGDSAPALPTGSQRLLAFLALRDRSVTRLSIAGTLWPDASEQHAAASLRSALTRLRGEARAAVEVGDLDIHLASGVRVDIRESKMLAHRLLEPDAPRMDPDAAGAAISALSSDLLPDWYEDWVLMETAEWRQLRLHALEAVAEHLSKEGRWAQAIAAAQAAIRAAARDVTCRPRARLHRGGQPDRGDLAVRAIPHPAQRRARTGADEPDLRPRP